MSAEHRAMVVGARSLASRTAELIDHQTSSGRAVVLLHGGAVDAAEITLELQERGREPLLRSGSVEFVHRSGGPPALRAAALGVSSHADEPPHLIVVHPLSRPPANERDPCGIPAINDERPSPWSTIVCLFGSDHAATAGLGAVVRHRLADLDGIEVALTSREGRMLALDLLLDFLEDPALVHQMAVSPVVETLERPTVQRLVGRRLAALSATPAVASSSASASGSVSARSSTPADHDSIQHAVLSTDGQLDHLLAVALPWLGSQVLIEDAHQRPVAWHPHQPRPSSLTELITGGRLARLAARLAPGEPEIVRLGTPSAGTRLVMRIGVAKLLGYVSVEGFNSSRTKVAMAKDWLRHLAPLLAGELTRRESWDRLRSESRGELITLLTQGLLSPPSARRALHALIGAGGARVAAVGAHGARTSAPGGIGAADPSPVMRHLHRLGVAYGEFQGLTVVLLNADDDATGRLVEALADAPVAIGFGSVAEQPDALPTSARQAAWTCRMALATGQRVLDFTGIGIHRLFLPGAEGGDPDFEEPIQRLEQRHRDLGFDGVQTLTGYLDSGANMRRAADLLLVHVNTLRYRLQRIATTTGVDLGDPEQRFRLQLALRLRAGRHALQESGNVLPAPTNPD